MNLFLFDIDGTLLRGSTPVHRDAFGHAYRTVYGLSLDLDGVSAAGRTDTWLLAAPLRRHGMRDEEIWARMPAAFEAMEAYVDQHLGDLRDRLLPGVPEVLRELHERGQLLGLLTGNLAGIAMAKMRKAGLARYFDTGGFGEESEIRAHLVPVALAKAAETLRIGGETRRSMRWTERFAGAGHAIPPNHAVVIGDTPLDIEAGHIAGTRTVGVATGPFTVEQLQAEGADLVLPSFEDAKASSEALMALGR